MKPSVVRLAFFSCILAALLPACRAAEVVLLLHSGDSWQAVEAEKIAINDKLKLRTGAAVPDTLQPALYKKLQPELILRAGLLRRHSGGYLVRRVATGWAPIVPDGLPFKAPASYASIWSEAQVSIQKDRTAKGLTPVPTASIFAIIPASDRNAAVVDFIADPANFHGVGEADEAAAFNERKALLIGVAGWVAGPPAAKLQQILLTEMETANQRLSAGIAHYTDLEHGLQYVEISEKAYPSDPRQKKDRDALRDTKAWLDRRIAILRAFNAGELWDAFVDKYSDFSRYENSFDDLRKMRQKAVVESANQHVAEGNKFLEAKDPLHALPEFQQALLRSPGNKEIESRRDEAKAEIEGDKGGIRQKERDLTLPAQHQITQRIGAAKKFIEQRKWKEAENELNEADKLDRGTYRIMVVRATLLMEQRKLLDALRVLDQYARIVPLEVEKKDPETAENLRGAISATLSSRTGELKAEIEKAEADGDYEHAGKSATEAVELDPSNLYFLLHAGRNNAILRKRDVAQQQFDQYLRLAQSSSTDEKERNDVYNYAAVLKKQVAEPQGTPNWFSGYKSPGVVYCPASLMLNAHPVESKAHKQTTSFEWSGDGKLVSVHTANEQNGERDATIFFDYFKDQPMVRRVSEEAFTKDEPAVPHFTKDGAVGTPPGAYVVLLNDPVIDPLMVEGLTGKRVATIVAGNPYFHPFVWNGVYKFLAEYDEQGRVKSATRIGAANQGPAILDFQWDGWHLTQITERGGGGYSRSIQYSGDKVSAEVSTYHGKKSKIEYKYRGDQLAEAVTSDDFDGRSRHVTFR